MQPASLPGSAPQLYGAGQNSNMGYCDPLQSQQYPAMASTGQAPQHAQFPTTAALLSGQDRAVLMGDMPANGNMQMDIRQANHAQLGGVYTGMQTPTLTPEGSTMAQRAYGPGTPTSMASTMQISQGQMIAQQQHNIAHMQMQEAQPRRRR